MKRLKDLMNEKEHAVMENSLSSLLQPMNTIRVDSTGEYLSPSGERSMNPSFFQSQAQSQMRGSPVDVFGQGRGYMQPDGTVIGVNPQGQPFKVQPEGTETARLGNRLMMAKVAEAERQAKPESKLTFSEAQGGFIEPPSQQFPNGRLIPVEGMKPKSQGKPLPAPALKMQQEELDAIGTAKALNADLSSFSKMIDTGKLNLGLTENLTGQARNYMGMSTDQSRNLASFTANLERLRNESLRLNKGVQTEGDAVRAWNEIVKNINDPKLVKQRLQEVQKVNERAVLLRKMNVDSIRGNYGHDPLDLSGRDNLEPAYGDTVKQGFDADKEARYQAWKAQQGAR